MQTLDEIRAAMKAQDAQRSSAKPSLDEVRAMMKEQDAKRMSPEMQPPQSGLKIGEQSYSNPTASGWEDVTEGAPQFDMTEAKKEFLQKKKDLLKRGGIRVEEGFSGLGDKPEDTLGNIWDIMAGSLAMTGGAIERAGKWVAETPVGQTVGDFLGKALNKSVGVSENVLETMTKPGVVLLEQLFGEEGRGKAREKALEFAENSKELWEAVPQREKDAIIGAGHILDLYYGVKGTKAVAKSATAPIVKKTAEALELSAEKGFEKQAVKIAAPKIGELSEAQRAALPANQVKEGVLGKREVIPKFKDSSEAAADLIREGKLKPSQSVVTQRKVVDKEIGDLAKEVKANLSQFDDRAIPVKEFETKLATTVFKFTSNPTLELITGDPQKLSFSYLNQASKFVEELTEGADTITPGQIFEVRKKMDRWIKSQKGDKAFASDIDNVLTTTNKELRDSLNNLVDELAPEAKADILRKKQSSLFELDDILSNRFAKEKVGVMARYLKKVQDSTGISAGVLPFLIAGGTTGAILNPARTLSVAGIIGSGAIALKAGRVVLSPNARKGMAELLRKIKDPVLKKEGKDIIAALTIQSAKEASQ